MKHLILEFRPCVMVTAVLVCTLCGAYPLLVWVLAQLCFSDQANGSLLIRQGTVAGSRLIAQNFSEEQYFHPRPSKAGTGYNAARSGGSNLGPLSEELIGTVRRRVADFRSENDLPPSTPVPADAITASGSGLDPHISARNALLQAPRVARARGIPEEAVLKALAEHTENRTLGFLGEPRINVLMVNLALDER